MSSVTRDINALLDDLLKPVNKAAKEMIVEQLNKITNHGDNVKDLFTNTYYVNDPGEDNRCASALSANNTDK